MAGAAQNAKLTVVLVSYNTRDLTLTAIRSLYDTTVDTHFDCVVWDNASEDGSADAIAEAFPQVTLIRSDENIGFAAANNRVVEGVETEWILLLNTDTEVYPGAVDNLMAFAKRRPDAGIYGGRTVFPDGSLNAMSCMGRITPWSMVCAATGLRAAFPRSEFFNPEGYGGWRRDTERDVDIVQGCFFLIRRKLWNELGGFRLKYYMYGEESDLCLRAQALGWQPMMTPDAEIMHIMGASSKRGANKVKMVAKARSTLIRDHWDRRLIPLGLFLMKAWAGTRWLATRPLAKLKGSDHPAAAHWSEIWETREDWLAGYR